MSDLIDRLKDRWVADGLTLRPGASSCALDSFEARYGVNLPPALRSYFAAVDGTGNDYDGGCFRFWPLSEVMPISEYHGCESGEVGGLERWFYFADFLVNSHCFAAHLTPDAADDGPVVFADGAVLVSLADSFAGFVERYLSDRDSLRYYLLPGEGSPIARDDEDQCLMYDENAADRPSVCPKPGGEAWPP